MGNCFDNNRYSVSSSLCEKKGPDGVRVKLKSRSPQKRLKSNGLEKLFFSDEILDKETDSQQPVLQRTPQFNPDFLVVDERKDDEEQFKHQGESTEESPPQMSALGGPLQEIQFNLCCMEEQRELARHSNYSNDSEETECRQIIMKQISNQNYDQESPSKETARIERIDEESDCENHFQNDVKGCYLCKQIENCRLLNANKGNQAETSMKIERHCQPYLNSIQLQ